MKSRDEFLKELNSLVALARENGNQITVEKVKEYFLHADLTEEQIELVFDYLLAQKVVVKGYVKLPASEDKPVITYTEEEKAYLESYMQELEVLKEETSEYLLEVVEIAKEMHHPEIFIGDMIQEGNLGLVIGMNQIDDVANAHDTIIAHIRNSIQMMIDEFEASKKQDDQMVEQVNMLDEAIKQLTDELGRKVTMDELAVHLGMTEEEIMDILRLMGEDVETEEQ